MIARRPSSTTGPLPPRRSAPKPVDLWGRLRWALAFVGFTCVVLYLTRSVISIVLASAAVAYLVDPVVSRLQRRGYKRDVAIFLIGLLGVAGIVLAGLIVIPGFAGQFADLSQNITPYLATISERLGPILARIEETFKVDVPVDVNELSRLAPDYVKKMSPDMRAGIQAFVAGIAGGGWAVILSSVSVSLMPVFTFYLLRDWPEIVASVDDLVPAAHRPLVRRLAEDIDGRIGAFIRGQIFVAFILGCVYTVGLLISGIDLAFTMGIVSGVLFLLPYLGPVIALSMSVVLALVKFGLSWHVAAVIATYGLGQVLENTFLTPMLIGDRVGLHPMVVIVALIVGGNLLGVWGLILALPVTASLAVVVTEILLRYRGSRTYRG